MIATVPQPQASAPRADSWEAFGIALREESAALQRLNAAAVHLTKVLVDGSPQAILESDRWLNSARIAHQQACSKRRGMQARGFGQMSLQQVCRYAPRHVSPYLQRTLSELTHGSIALGITISNNKSLIVAGLQRLVNVTHRLQEQATERTGVYKRRGYVAPPGASVLVSNKV
ncbi:MAG TPA: hypothetical protein VKT72_17795 [Candidatus Baltobacteraceae bacterium]|nr:hypothetical protein [Candidatus Baltobacteraceae bacterium]